jgi:hypothetical protein
MEIKNIHPNTGATMARSIKRKDVLKQERALNHNVLSETTVLNFPTHIEFPPAKAYPEVPAGIYYPSVDRSSNRFILMKINPNRSTSPISNGKPFGQGDTEADDFMRELAELLDDDIEINPSDFSDKLDIDNLQDTRFLDYGYFTMENYHTGLAEVESSIQRFLQSNDFYRTQNLGYKRSALLFGEPGTGKSRYIDNLSRRLIQNHNAIVFRIESSNELDLMLEKGMVIVNRVMEGRLKVFVIEELATLVRRGNHTEILNFLDNPLLREDVIFLMTTNTPELIPENIVDRPSRVDILAEVNCNGFKPGFMEAWYQHLMGEPMPEGWSELPFYREKLSPAYLKELFISMKINGVSVDESWTAIQERRRLIRNQFQQNDPIGFR